MVCIDVEPGGLLRSISIKGYLFDIGGSHVVFSKDPAVLNGILSLVGERTRKAGKAYISLNGYLLPYPFENGIYVLPPEQRARYGHSIILALLENARHGERKPASLRDWIVNTFGREVAEDYLIPYNEKIWKRPVDQISADWVYTPGRLPLPGVVQYRFMSTTY
ncbi:amine oxidase [Pyrobaculum ferrireducens]|uniref:Amine oxidase n=1 Tax=Pyrobaculum ferrireducens TaxID=1104324 RepID=G7VI05_9CREN|nr:amine oxidase [Pyrobaculum ferrireducens]